MILDMFKPAWQSANPARRRKGVQKLNPDITDEADVLFSLASQDTEQAVRLAAIERISNITLLVRLLKNAPTSLEQDKLGRLVTLATLKESVDHEGLQKAVELIDMDDDLLEIAMHAVSSNAQAQAVHKMVKQEPLLVVATKHPLSKLRLTAAEKIHHPTLLNQLLEKSKGRDKSVWRITKEKIDSARQQELAVEHQRQIANECFDRMQAMQNQDIDTLFKQKWLLLKNRWEEIPAGEKNHLDVKSLIDLIEQRIAGFEANTQEEETQIQSRAEAEHEQQEALNLIAQALGILKDVETNAINIPSLRATLTTQTSRWGNACEHNQPSAQQQATFDRDSKKLAQAIDAIYTLREHLGAIKAIHEELHQLAADDLARNADLYDKTIKLLKRIQWPAEVIIPKDLHRLNSDFQCLQERQRRQADVLLEHQQRIRQLIDQLVATLDDGKLQDTDTRVKKIQAALKKLPEQNAEPFRQELKPLLAQYSELKDWQAFAAQPKKEALILSMEGLAQDTTDDVDPSVRLDYIQKLQAEWKELGRLNSTIEKQLWDKFQTASKAAYAPCKAFYEEQANTRDRNKAHKEKMCAQLKDYIDRYNWSKADWSSVQNTLKVAREEWRQYVPVDRKYHKALEERFQELMDQLNDRLQQHKQSNQRIKQRLLEQAHALLIKDDTDEAITAIRRLRDEWRSVGMLPPDSYKSINQAFFDIYNQLTERKKKQWSDTHAQKQHNALQIKASLDGLEQLINESPEHILSRRQEIQHIEQTFTEYSPLTDEDQKALRHRFKLLTKTFEESVQQAKQNLQQQSLQTLWHLSEVLRRLEKKVLLHDLSNASLQELTEEWNQIPDTNHPAIATLNARFDAAIDARVTANLQALQSASEKADIYAREICILTEILAEKESPASDAELRMQLQVNRLNQSLQNRSDSKTELNEYEYLSLEWCITGPLSPSALAELDPRFKAARDTCC